MDDQFDEIADNLALLRTKLEGKGFTNEQAFNLTRDYFLVSIEHTLNADHNPRPPEDDYPFDPYGSPYDPDQDTY